MGVDSGAARSWICDSVLGRSAGAAAAGGGVGVQGAKGGDFVRLDGAYRDVMKNWQPIKNVAEGSCRPEMGCL